MTHLLVTCHACGYNDHALDSDPSRVKAAVRVNGGGLVHLKHYTLKDGGGIAGNASLRLVAPDTAAYGGVGGGFRTNTMVVPISGLRVGMNTLSFTHVNADLTSIGFRILKVNVLRGNSPSATVLANSQFVQEDPATWTAARAAGTSNGTALQAAINEGKELWFKNGHLYDAALDRVDGTAGGRAPLNGRIEASCSNCHAQDGRDLAYFNFSNHSIVERAFFHGVPRSEGRKIAAYIRSLNLRTVAKARPWNPPYQPGPGLDARPAYEWAAGVGIEGVLDRDGDTERYLFPRGTSAAAVKDVVNRFGKLNMRELPIAIQLPDWNQWLPRVHPSDAFNASAAVVSQDETGKGVGAPFYETLYRQALSDPSPRNIGNMVRRLEQWMGRGGTCFTQSLDKGPGWRATNSPVNRSLRLGTGVAAGVITGACEAVRFDRALNRPLELAKQGLMAWITVKHWEINHTRDLETRSAALTQKVCIGSVCVDASEARGWVTEDKYNVGMNVFTRAPHYVSYNSRDFLYQHPTVGRYESNAWYHLQLVLNAGHRRTAPNHYIYTIDFLEELQRRTRVSQSYRFWASAIKMRQTQTNGRYGVEDGLQLHSAQPYHYYSDGSGDTSLRAGVGGDLWKRIADAMLLDFAQDASRGNFSTALQNGTVQAANSTDFDLCPQCFGTARGRPRPFSDKELVGRNTARVIEQLRKIGVSEASIGPVINWGKATWPRGPWDQLRR